jgi:hypothetical protein
VKKKQREPARRLFNTGASRLSKHALTALAPPGRVWYKSSQEEATVPVEGYLTKFVHLLVVPFDNLGTAWPILPIYTTLILGEIYKSKVSFSHAVVNGFAMLWTGLNWARGLASASWAKYLFSGMPLAWIVAATAIGLGIFSIILGLRKKDKALCEVLGHTRFSCYFLITIYPMQHVPQLAPWRWENMAAILIFAIPCWFLIYLMGRLVSKWLK